MKKLKDVKRGQKYIHKADAGGDMAYLCERIASGENELELCLYNGHVRLIVSGNQPGKWEVSEESEVIIVYI